MTSRILPFLHASILACLYSWLLTFLHSDILAYFNTDSWTSHPTSSPSPSHISREIGFSLLSLTCHRLLRLHWTYFGTVFMTVYMTVYTGSALIWVSGLVWHGTLFVWMLLGPVYTLHRFKVALCSANNWHPSRMWHGWHFQWLKCNELWTIWIMGIVSNTLKMTLQHPSDDKLTITGTI